MRVAGHRRRGEGSIGVVDRTREYYNSDDADGFYHEIWGGEDIHIGIYRTKDEPIATASHRTVETMAGMLPALSECDSVLDLGSGYGGSARHLTRSTGCRVVCLNLSETQNCRNRERNREEGLDGKIGVIDGSFEDIPLEAETFDVVWSQDAILHSGCRKTVFREVDRVLKPGGHFIFTDPMQSERVPARDLRHVLARLHLDSLGTVACYRKYADDLGWEFRSCRQMLPQLVRHYRRVHEELSYRRSTLEGRVSPDYIQRMLTGLMYWIEAGRAGRLDWGILHFIKPGA